MRTYRIRNWGRVYEVSDAKRTHSGKPLPWVAIPTKHDGRGYRRLMKRSDGMEIFAAFILIVQVAAKLPERGVLLDDDGPLTAVDLADKTGGNQVILEKAMQVLSDKSLGIYWLEVSGDTKEYVGVAPPTYTQDVHDTTRRDVTEQDKTNGSAIADVPKKKGRGKSSGPHQGAIDYFSAAYLAKYTKPYIFQGGKDGDHVKWMLTQVEGNAAALNKVFDDYLGNDDPWFVKDRHSLGLLKSQFRKFIVPEPVSTTRTGTDELNFGFEEPSDDALSSLNVEESK